MTNPFFSQLLANNPNLAGTEITLTPDNAKGCGGDERRHPPGKPLTKTTTGARVHPQEIPVPTTKLLEKKRMRHNPRPAEEYIPDTAIVVKGLGSKNATVASRIFHTVTKTKHPRSNKGYEQVAQDFHSKQYWVSLEVAKAKPLYAADLEKVRYYQRTYHGTTRDVACVPASRECLRHEIINNGGRTREERKQQMKRAKEAKQYKGFDFSFAAAAFPGDHTGPVFFNATDSDSLEEYLKDKCDRFVKLAGNDAYDRGGREGLVKQFWTDLEKQKKAFRTTADGTGYASFQLVAIANALGNSMVGWHQKRCEGGAAMTTIMPRETQQHRKSLWNDQDTISVSPVSQLGRSQFMPIRVDSPLTAVCTDSSEDDACTVRIDEGSVATGFVDAQSVERLSPAGLELLDC